MPNTLKTDVLIIGAGAAGIRAALASSEAGARVVVLSKGDITESGSTFSEVSKGWGIQALAGKERTERNLEAFYNEIIDVGLGKCDTELVRILVEESGSRFDDLVSYGLRFQRDMNSNYLRFPGCFGRGPRAFVTESYGNIRETFRTMLRKSRALVIQGRIVDLTVIDGTCWGALSLPKGNEGILKIRAKATILASGGGAGLFTNRLAAGSEAGDGYALAHRAGAKMINLEFIQFMLGLKTGDTRGFLPLPELPDPGRLRDETGADLIEKSIPDIYSRRRALSLRTGHFPFSCRDDSGLIDLAVARRQQAGSKVYWVSRDTATLFEVVHCAHAFNGGIAIDPNGESTVRGLFAAGEVSAGPHGADRLGGCMMTATQVFGHRAGRAAGLRAKKTHRLPSTNHAPDPVARASFSSGPALSGPLASRLLDSARNRFSDALGVIRQEKPIRDCIRHIKDLASKLRMTASFSEFALDVRNALTAMQIIAAAALDRRGSLGSHYRKDTDTQRLLPPFS